MRSASSPCAIGIRSATRRRGGARLEAGRDRAAAAVSAVFHHDDRQFADRMARGGRAGRAGGGDHRAVLLPDRSRTMSPPPPRCCARRWHDGARAAGSSDWRCACCSPRTACRKPIVQGGDPVPVADRADRRARAGGLGRGRARLGDLLSVARDAAALDRTRAPRRRSSARRTTGSPCWSCRSRLSRSIPRRWWNSTSTIARLAERLGVPRLFPGAGAERRCRRSSRRWRIWCGARAAHGPGLCSPAGGRICPATETPVPGRAA